MAVVKRATIIGLGLIGGSLGMALRRHKLAGTVVGVSRRSSTLQAAKRLGAIDEGSTRAVDAVGASDLVVLATPVDMIPVYAKRVASAMPVGSILTDVGSSKGRIVKELERVVPSRVSFIGGHPIAGSHRRGIEAAEANLFDGATWILTPTSRTSLSALHRLTRLCTRLAGQVITLSPTKHDQILAATSHLPHLLAYCLSLSLRPSAFSCAPKSLLEVTRLAKSDPDLWDDIFLSNRQALLSAMDRFEKEWKALRSTLTRGGRQSLRRRLIKAKARREYLEQNP